MISRGVEISITEGGEVIVRVEGSNVLHRIP